MNIARIKERLRFVVQVNKTSSVGKTELTMPACVVVVYPHTLAPELIRQDFDAYVNEMKKEFKSSCNHYVYHKDWNAAVPPHSH